MTALELLATLQPAIADIDGGCHNCISNFVDKANRLLRKAEEDTDELLPTLRYEDYVEPEPPRRPGSRDRPVTTQDWSDAWVKASRDRRARAGA